MLNRRNKQFERRIGGKMRASNDEDECMDEDHTDDNTRLTESAVTNNGK
jgi:hypothetical protein